MYVAISIKWYMLYIVLPFSTWKKIHPACKESFWFRFVIPFSDCLLSYGKPVAGCMWCCGIHVGGQEQKHFSPLGSKLYFM